MGERSHPFGAQDLLVTKFTIPPGRSRLLPRASLIERLNQGGGLPLALLSAGAGFGKTTLLSAFFVINAVKKRQKEKTIWTPTQPNLPSCENIQ